MSIISAQAVFNYDIDAVRRAVAFHLEALDAFSFIRPGMKVIIKPNLLTAKKPEAAVTTHPGIVRALAEQLRAHGVTDITVAESSGGPYLQKYLEATYAATGFAALSDVVKLNTDTSFVSVSTPPGSLVPAFNIIRPIAEADVVINVAKLKTHGMTGVSAGMKNLFGCVPGLQKPEMHYRFPKPEDFCRMICELDQLVKPALTLIDAVECMEGNGPSGGTPRHYGAILAARDIYALDEYAVRLMGMNPDESMMLIQARALGLLTGEAPTLLGDALTPADPPFLLPDSHRFDFTSSIPAPLAPIAKRFLSAVLKPVPRVYGEMCVGCGKCAESCPMHIIEIRDHRANIGDRKKCISCFCCQEMCPVKAIYVKRHIRNL